MMRKVDMMSDCSLRRGVAVSMVAALAFMSLPLGRVQAELVTTERAITAAEGAASERARVQAFFDRKDVRQELERLGVDPAEARARVDSLAEAEIERIAGKLDAVPAGQGGLEAAVIGLSIFSAIVLLQARGWFPNFFGFICPPGEGECVRQITYPPGTYPPGYYPEGPYQQPPPSAPRRFYE